MSNKRGLSGIYLILIVFGIALFWILGLGILAREEVYLGLSPTVVVGNGSNATLEKGNSEVSQEQNIAQARERELNLERQIEGLEYNGWIVEFKEEPLAVKNKELEESNVAFADKKAILVEQKNKIRTQHEELKNKLRQVSPKVKVEREFDTVFNGLSISNDMAQEELEELKRDPNVRRITPNYFVYTTLMDSVPLINADDVWQLDMNGNNCVQSGEECLTGKGVTIGIIDTGVDYTHPDLGNCNYTELNEFEGGKQSYNLNSEQPYNSYNMFSEGRYFFHYYTWYISFPGFDRLSIHLENITISSKDNYFVIHNSTANDDFPQFLRSAEIFEIITKNISDKWIVSSGNTLKISAFVRSSYPELPPIEKFGNFAMDKIGIGNHYMNWSLCEKVIDGWDFI